MSKRLLLKIFFFFYLVSTVIEYESKVYGCIYDPHAPPASHIECVVDTQNDGDGIFSGFSVQKNESGFSQKAKQTLICPDKWWLADNFYFCQKETRSYTASLLIVRYKKNISHKSPDDELFSLTA